jgi:hypothetical protein
MVILIPLSAVIMGFIMLSLAIESDTGLVIDDYYKKGKEINLVLARDEMAASLGLAAELTLRNDLKRIRLKLESQSGSSFKAPLQMSFMHATRQGYDQQIALHQVVSADAGDNVYAGNFNELKPGRWNVQLATPDWRLVGSLDIPGSSRIQLTPAYTIPVNAD